MVEATCTLTLMLLVNLAFAEKKKIIFQSNIPLIRLKGQAECCCFGKTGHTASLYCVKLVKYYISSIFPEFPKQSNSSYCSLAKQ